MYEWIIPAVGGVSCAVSWALAMRTRKHLRLMRELEAQMGGIRKFYNWGKECRIVVRDKVGHVNVTDKSLLDLYMDFEMGRAFRNAAMMYQNEEFKVYVQAKGE